MHVLNKNENILNAWYWVLSEKSQKLIPSKINQSVLIVKISSRKTQKIAIHKNKLPHFFVIHMTILYKNGCVFYTLEPLRRARRKLTNTTLDVEQPRQRGGSQTLLFSAWVWSLGYNTLCRKVAYNSMFMRITLIKKKEYKRQRWRNLLDHSTRIGWVIRLHEGLAKQNSELHLEQYWWVSFELFPASSSSA